MIFMGVRGIASALVYQPERGECSKNGRLMQGEILKYELLT